MSKAQLRRKADKLWYAKYLKEWCEVCGGNYVLQGHHFYYKGSSGHLRYSKDNHITLCKKCHFSLHYQEPKRIEEKIIVAREQKWYQELRDKSRETPASYQLISYYKQVIEQLTL